MVLGITPSTKFVYSLRVKAFWISLFFCMCFLSWIFHRRTAPLFSLPFPRLRRFGTHCETGSKFLLLFSIKSKKESFCFAKIVPNGRTSDVVQEKYLARMSPIGACAANLDAPAPLFHSPKS